MNPCDVDYFKLCCSDFLLFFFDKAAILLLPYIPADSIPQCKFASATV